MFSPSITTRMVAGSFCEITSQPRVHLRLFSSSHHHHLSAWAGGGALNTQARGREEPSDVSGCCVVAPRATGEPRCMCACAALHYSRDAAAAAGRCGGDTDSLLPAWQTSQEGAEGQRCVKGVKILNSFVFHPAEQPSLFGLSSNLSEKRMCLAPCLQPPAKLCAFNFFIK